MSRQSNGPSRLLGRLIARYPGIEPARSTFLVGWLLTGVACVHTACVQGGAALGCAMTGTVLGLLMIHAWWRQLPRGVDLFQHGLEYWCGDWRRRVYWNQIAEIYQASLHPLDVFWPSASGRGWRYRLVSRDGTSLDLQRLEGIHDLGQRIDVQVTNRHLPLALEAYRSGYTLRFGRQMAVNCEGIHIRGRFIAWHAVVDISIGHNDELRIGYTAPTQRTIRLACIRIANLRVLDGVLQAVRSGETDDTAEIDIFRNLSQFEESFISYAESPLEMAGGPGEGNDLDHFDSLDLDVVTLEGLLRHIPQHRPRHPR